jgi:hypothetical protein
VRGTPCHHPTKNIPEVHSILSRLFSHLLNGLVGVVARVQVREDEHVRPPRHLAGAALQLGAGGFGVYCCVVLEGALDGQVRPLLLRELGRVNNLLDSRAYRRNEGYAIVGLLSTAQQKRVSAQPCLRFGKLFLELLLGELGRDDNLPGSKACGKKKGYLLDQICYSELGGASTGPAFFVFGKPCLNCREIFLKRCRRRLRDVVHLGNLLVERYLVARPAAAKISSGIDSELRWTIAVSF